MVLTASHMRCWHGISLREYETRFPGKPVSSREFCRNRSESNSNRWATALPGEYEKFCSNLSKIVQLEWASKTLEEYRDICRSMSKGYDKKVHSLITKKLWREDQDYQRVQAEARHRKPTEAEAFLNMWLQRHFPGEWKYTGDGKDGTYIGGRNPDFLNVNGKKLVIEVFGSYYHGPELTDATEEDKIMHYKEYGFGCLVLWEDEVYDEGKVVRRVGTFVGGRG